MKIALFGGSGGAGRYILKELLSRNYQVKALVRNATSLEEYQNDNNLEIIVGDALDEDSVKNTIFNCDAVISALGQRKGSPKDLQTKSIEYIIGSMQKNNIKRLICLTGAGVYLDGDNPSLMDNMITTMVKTTSPVRYNDGAGMVEKVMQSQLDWTIVRTQLQENKPYRENGHIGMLGTKGHTWKCSRGFIAKFMTDNLTESQYIHQAPVISD